MSGSGPDSRMPRSGPGVLVLGEVLVELSCLEPLVEGASLRLGFSGDALNAAAAAAAAGAHTVLVSRVPDDELGDALLARVDALGIDSSWMIRSSGQHGLYLTHADPLGERQFVYVRRSSAGSMLCAEDLDDALVSSAGIVVASGVTCALSESAAAAVRHAARVARRFVYDPNFRPRLTSPDAAAAVLRDLAPLAEVITPSWPGETGQLLGLGADTSPMEALTATLGLGARHVVLTRGPQGALVGTGAEIFDVPRVVARTVVDQTGAGDCLTGTVAARLALGDGLVEAVQLGVAAAALSVQGQGGTGRVPALEESMLARPAAHLIEEMTPR